MLTKESTSIERNRNDPELSVTCEATGCYSMATNRIAVKVGNLGAIPLMLCSNYVAEFQEAE